MDKNMAKRSSDKLTHKGLTADIAAYRSAQDDPARLATLRALGNTGNYGDGNGLTLIVTTAGRARWVHKYQWQGKTRERWLPGDFPEIGLAEARELRDADRKLLRAGVNPITHAKAETEAAKGIPSFAEYARQHSKYLAPNGADARAQWLRQMTGGAGVTAGDLLAMPIDDIRLEHVKPVISPLWVAQPATAKELCGRIRRVLDHRYTNTEQHERRNPAEFKLVGRAIGKKFERKTKHRAALDYKDVPALLVALAKLPQVSARALEFVIATGSRANEVTEACWGEFDFRARTWTVPAERMKAGEPHVVPISRMMLATLRKVLPRGVRPAPGDLVFPNGKGRPFNDKDLLAQVKIASAGLAVDRTGATATTHGFRSSLMNWGTGMEHRKVPAFDRDLMNVCLAHAIGDDVSQAYLRDRWLERRRIVMQEWSWFCLTRPSATILPFRRAA
jgi:integrase